MAPSEQVVNDYVAHLERPTFKEMARLPGFLGACLSRKLIDGRHELLAMSHWEDMDAVRSFAKGILDDAVVKPETQSILTSWDAKLEHFEVVAGSAVAA